MYLNEVGVCNCRCFWNGDDSGSILYRVLKFPLTIMDVCTSGNCS